MDQIPASEQSEGPRARWIWILVAPTLVILYVVLGVFDSGTELRPTHQNVLQVCFAIAGLSAFCVGSGAIYLTKGLLLWRRAVTSFVLALLVFISVLLIAGRPALIIEGAIDSPPGKTQTLCSVALIPG